MCILFDNDGFKVEEKLLNLKIFIMKTSIRLLNVDSRLFVINFLIVGLLLLLPYSQIASSCLKIHHHNLCYMPIYLTGTVASIILWRT